MTYTFDGANKLIVLPTGETQIQIADIYSRWVEWLLTGDNSKYLFAFRTIGGDDLGGGITAGVYYFLQNDIGWRIRPQEADHELTLVGNLFAQQPATAMFVPTLGDYTVAISMVKSSLTQVIVQNTGSALTQAEHDQLMALPTATLTPAQDAKLTAIPSETLTSSEHNQLMAIPTTAGLTQAEHDQLMAIPLSQVALTQEEHDQLMAIPELAAAASSDATLGEVLQELASVPASTPTVRQALMFLYMLVRNKSITTDTTVDYHNAAGSVIAHADIDDDGVTMVRDNLQ